MSFRATPTGHGLSIIGWTLLMCLGVGMAVRGAGLKYAQGVVWPTDIHAFSQLATEPDSVDIVVFGSSRASFAITPGVMDSCLESAIGRPSRTYNLARTFSTSRSAHILATDLLEGERTPQVLVLALGPEFFDEFNHRTAVDMDANLDPEDIPSELGHLSSLDEVIAVMRPLAHGIERAALYLSGRHDENHRLRWMMVHQRGGQFCLEEPNGTPEGEACKVNNQSVLDLLDDNWYAARYMEDRFSEYEVGNGPVHQHMLQLISWAESHGVQLVLADLPLHEDFSGSIPPQATERFEAYITTLVEEHNLLLFRSSDHTWARTRGRYIDPDHLNYRGSARYTRELCEVLGPLLGEG